MASDAIFLYTYKKFKRYKNVQPHWLSICLCLLLSLYVGCLSFYWWFLRILKYIIDTCFLFKMWFAYILSQSVVHIVIIFTWSCSREKLLMLGAVYHIFLHISCFWCLILRTVWESLDSQKFPPKIGFPGCSVIKNPPANAGDMGSIPGWGRSPGEGNGNPLKYPCLGNPMDRIA